MSDPFSDFATSLESPASNAYDIVPDDNADIQIITRALNVSAEGTVRITTHLGQIVTLYVAAGGAFPIRARRVWATGTSATGIVGLY